MVPLSPSDPELQPLLTRVYQLHLITAAVLLACIGLQYARLQSQLDVAPATAGDVVPFNALGFAALLGGVCIDLTAGTFVACCCRHVLRCCHAFSPRCPRALPPDFGSRTPELQRSFFVGMRHPAPPANMFVPALMTVAALPLTLQLLSKHCSMLDVVSLLAFGASIAVFVTGLIPAQLRIVELQPDSPLLAPMFELVAQLHIVVAGCMVLVLALQRQRATSALNDTLKSKTA